MSATTVCLAILLGIAAGVLAGMFGVGGGILFVPALVVLGLDQLEAQGTSLLAIIPTVVVGTLSQRRYGNLRARTAVVVGLASIVGSRGGSASRNGVARGLAATAVRRPPVRRGGAARLEDAPANAALP